MKIVLIAFLMTAFSLTSFSQKRNDLLGEWQVQHSGENGQLTLKKYERDSLTFGNWGVFFEFREDGTYSEYASAPCGLDDNHYRYSGKWTYDQAKGIIKLKEINVENDRPGIYNDYEVLDSGKIKIISVSENTISISVIKPWEKVSEKNKNE